MSLLLGLWDVSVWSLVIWTVVSCHLTLLTVTVYLHRALAHRALTLSPVLTGVFRGVIWLLTGIRPRQWAAVHRKHHAFTDEAEDFALFDVETDLVHCGEEPAA